MNEKSKQLSWLTAFFLSALIGFSSLKGAEGSFDVFGSETLAKSGTQFYTTQKWKTATRLVDGSKTVSNVNNDRRIEWRSTFGVNHSLDKAWQIGLFFPLISRRYRFDNLEGNLTGIGDATIYTKYRLYKKNWQRGAQNISAILAFDLPIGQHGHHEKGVRLPEALQLGSGAINTIFGLSAGWEFHKFGISTLSLHTFKPTGAHHFNRGNSTQIDLTMKYRFYQEPYPGAAGNFRWGVTYEHNERSKKRGRKIYNSGGHSWEGKIGWVHHPTPPTDITFFYRFPLSHSLHGIQLVTEHSIQLALGYRF